jgi:hypothetical protein
MSLGKIHIFGLYIPSQKIERRATSTKKHQASTSPQSMLPNLRAPISPKGIKRSAQKVLHVKNRKVVASIGVKEPKDATCKQQQQCKSLDSRRRSQVLCFDALRVVVVPLLAGQPFGASGGTLVVGTLSASAPLFYWFSAASCA